MSDLTRPESPLLERALVAYARRFPVQKGKVRVVDRLWQRAAGAAGDRRTARLDSGFDIVCDLSQQLQRQYYYFGTYWLERAELACWQEIARRSATVLDVGANLGVYSLAARAANAESVIHAFEPTPAHAAHLRQTLSSNGIQGLHVHELAVGATSGEAVLNMWSGDRGDNEGMNFITDAPRSAETVAVQMTSLDDFCARQGILRIDLMKMDVQGNERTVLNGAQRLLSDERIGTVFVELNWGDTPACPATAVVEVLESAGFLFSEPRWPLRFRASGPWMRACQDVVARTGEVTGSALRAS